MYKKLYLNRTISPKRTIMIPKKIHYVWVGDQEKPALVLHCIESWKKFLPDYEIIEWNNSSLHYINNDYASEAFSAKRWAFVSDYLRLYALYHHGGIYLDTDVEVTQNLDNFLHNDFFMGSEPYQKKFALPMTAVIGAKKNNSIVKGLLEHYNSLNFIKKDGLDLTANPYRFAEYFEKKFNLLTPYTKDKILKITDNSHIYPTYFFCTPQKNQPNFTIHFFDGSWLDGFSRREKLRIAKYKIIRFKRINNYNNIIPLHNNENIIARIPISKNFFYAIVK